MSAMVRESGRASARAAITDVAAVRIAVVMVSSLRCVGWPVATSASTPKAITVGRPCWALLGWPLTYLKLYWTASATGINSMTPVREWLATRATLSKSAQRRKSAVMAASMRRSTWGSPWAATMRAMSWVVSSVVMVQSLALNQIVRARPGNEKRQNCCAFDKVVSFRQT